MEVSNEDRQKMMQELGKSLFPTRAPKGDDEFTPRDMAEVLDLDISVVRKRLLAEVRQGTMTRRKAVGKLGVWNYVYRKADDSV